MLDIMARATNREKEALRIIGTKMSLFEYKALDKDFVLSNSWALEKT